MAGYHCLMPLASFFLQSGSPNIIPMCNVLLLLAITDVWYDTPGFQIRVNGILSNNIRILTPN